MAIAGIPAVTAFRVAHVLIASAAFVILLVAGIQGLMSWLRQRRAKSSATAPPLPTSAPPVSHAPADSGVVAQEKEVAGSGRLFGVLSEQDGTLAYCFEGRPYYFSWWEMFPTGVILVGSTVQPGDLITASVTVSGGSNYTLSLTDATHPADSFSTAQTGPPTTCQDSSADWIIERPTFNIGVGPLSIFSDWNVLRASETSGGVTGGIAVGPGATQVIMVDATNTYPLVNVSGLSPAGNGFRERWLNSY